MPLSYDFSLCLQRQRVTAIWRFYGVSMALLYQEYAA